MSATESDAFGRCHWCGNMTDSAGCLSVSCSSRAASHRPMSEGLFTVSREFVNRVEERVGMGADSREFVRPERICEAVIAEREATRAAPSAAPGEAVAWGVWSEDGGYDHICNGYENARSIADDQNRLNPDGAPLRVIPLYAAPAPVRVSEAMVTAAVATVWGVDLSKRSLHDVMRDVLTAALAAQEGK